MTHRVDGNQRAIVAALREAGASVCSLAGVGGGVPDLLCAFAGDTFLLECKDLSGRGIRFTPAQRKFMESWKGTIRVVCSPAEALALLDAVDV